MYSITEYYEEVKLKAQKSGKCSCGKRKTRATTFSQTLNPFNKKDGRLKTREEIGEELIIEKEKWLEEPISCIVPSYWSWTKEQREEYEKKGKVNIQLDCGAVIEKIKPNFKK